MNATQRRALEQGTSCEIRYDTLTRQLHATDASAHQIVPSAVAFPASDEDASTVLRAAIEAGIPVSPKGAGTGLAGGALGDGLVVDFARHNRGVGKLDRERTTIWVEAGVVLDQLNAALKPDGFAFGPDVATSSRATLGGMIANNSSGARAPIYGTTGDHIRSLHIVMTNGRVETLKPGQDTLPDIHRGVAALAERHTTAIDERMPEGLMKRWPGYGFDRWKRSAPSLIHMIAGSEGTLAGILAAELEVVPLPRKKSLGILFFHTITEAMAATVDIQDLEPAAIEHIDRTLLDQTVGKLAFKKSRDVLGLDAEPCEALLLVEFYDDNDGRLDTLMERRLGHRRLAYTEPGDMEHVWFLRKAGLSLLTSCKGASKPTSGIEDVAVLPEVLPAYVEGLQRLMEPLGLRGSFYGHAASGLLHVRPVVDMHDPEDLAKYRQLADEVSALVKEFKGSLTAEHGVGISRTEYLADHLGPGLMDAVREVKALFDPKNLMNPGKILPTGRYRIDGDLRWGAGYKIPLPFEPTLAFAAKDESFIGNLEQCNGCGGCRKDLPTMCPTFLATGEEIMSTRGRSNTIRAVLDGRSAGNASPLDAPELEEALKFCLSCKACTKECPSNVNMALMKAELLHARQKRDGISFSSRLVSRVDALGRLGTLAPTLANATLESDSARWLMEKVLGFTAQRPLPLYADQRFDHWFQDRPSTAPGKRGRVILWDDCFVRYNEPNIGRAAVVVLEAAGYEVDIPKGRSCCGRPAFSSGCLDEATQLGTKNIALFAGMNPKDPILFLEPSCYSMFAQDYRELGLEGAKELAERSFLFEDFVNRLLSEEPKALAFSEDAHSIAIHVHCHAKSLMDSSVAADLANRIPNASLTTLSTGCCGMAGSFGAKTETYEVSVKVAEPLIEQLDALEPGTKVVASGASCRHQVEHLRRFSPQHIAELLADALQ
ncbi:MAG: FAD-linked oxidase C-terminal domain-containing protein [Candidatus Hydrogenedentes bacterium]|jgi:FAD/FMN-containing dehydrogenase/Fe-S oxidoreductase|nr:FAD-linked oxidase C-terminal domain-containing protein [Candidatus Hydrogenedentota bacterium]